MTPFTLAGAMAPITLAGAVAQQNAEALAGMVFTQVVRPGAPVVYGGFTSNVDMQSGAPAFGTPEYVRTAMLGGQLARRYAVPYRSSNVNAANALDAQAAYESVFSLWGAVMGGVNFLMHGAGWMEGGLQASARQARARRRPARRWSPRCSTRSSSTTTRSALDAIREVGPGGHFFGVEHTQQRFRTAFHRPMISDWRNYETWDEAGRPEAAGTRRRARPGASSTPTSHRRWTRPCARSSTTSSPAASPRAASRPTTEGVHDRDEIVSAGRRHRRWRRRRLGAVPPHRGRLDRRRARRAQGADRRLDVALGGRDAHAQRRPQRRPSCSSTRSSCTARSRRAPARTARSTCPAG